MKLADQLHQLATRGSDVRVTEVPEAWRPRMELGDTGGFLVSSPRPASEQPDASSVLAEFGLDPSAWSVVSQRRSKWQRHDGEWLESLRVNLAPVTPQDHDVDLEQLVEQVSRWRPTGRTKPSSGELTYVAAIGDTQYGKDAGDGTEGTVQRVLHGFDSAVGRFRELRRLGRPIGTIALPQLGDCIEGSSSQNGKVLGRSDLGVTQQVRLARRLLLAQIKAFAPLADQIVVPVVPGNHDEPHRVVITDPADSWQVEVAAAVQDACSENPALAHVQFRYPDRDEQTLAVRFGGVLVGFAHGHQSRDLVKWWQGQATGRTPVGDADLLITGHYHHLKIEQVGPRLWLQLPAMDGGSPWFRDKYGLEAPAGLVTLVVGDGWDPRRDLAVLAAAR